MGRLARVKFCLSLPYRHGVSLGVRATHEPGQPMSQGKKWLDYYKKFAML